MFKPWRSAFFDARSFPALVLGPVLHFALLRLARRRRSLVKTGFLGVRLRFRPLGIRILNFVICFTHLGPERFAVAINLPQSAVATRLRACKHPIEALE
jgi:hypothetical protein